MSEAAWMLIVVILGFFAALSGLCLCALIAKIGDDHSD
jgi:hypothetical protein